MPTSSVYHEKQARQLCALHALNNLFQGDQSYTKSELDDICNNLTPNVWINPHRSVLGLGNYDINVIMTALQKETARLFGLTNESEYLISINYVYMFRAL